MAQIEIQDEFLLPGRFIDSDSPVVQNLASYFQKKYSDKVKLATAFFYYVRDSFKYSINLDFFNPEIFKASYCLEHRKSFCMPKASALSALCRASSIPARLHFVDLKNHRIPDHLYKILGSNIFYYHCFAELYLNNKWIKATPSFDLQTCLRHELPPVEFDGENDGLFASHDDKGRKYCEYVNDRGVYADIPLEEILTGFDKYYSETKAKFIKNRK